MSPSALHSLIAFAGHESNSGFEVDSLSGAVTLFTALMAFAVLVGVATKLLRFPYTVALVLAGLFIAVLQQAPSGAQLQPDLVFFIILPPVLFRAGLIIDVRGLGRHWLPVLLVTGFGTVLTTLAVGFAIRWFLSPDMVGDEVVWLAAFMIGAMLSPTDPVSVLPAIRKLKLPTSIRMTVEGESLFNDGVAVVIFFILFGALFMPVQDSTVGDGPEHMQPVSAATAEHEPIIVGTDEAIVDRPRHGVVVDIWAGIVRFIGHTGLGLCLGAFIGFIAVLLMYRADDPVLENAITVVVAYGSFVVASQLHVSGVAAVIAAGMLLGFVRWRHADDHPSKQTITTFWESIDYIVNSLVFLIVGFELQFIGADSLLDRHVLLAVLAVYGAMLLARALVVYPCGRLTGAWTVRGGTVVFWSGLRGCVTLALVLVLPDNINGDPDALKEFVLPVVFGVVLLTLILQATTMRPLTKLVTPRDRADA